MDMGMVELGGEGSSSGLQKEEVRRGPWSVDEDVTLINYIAIHGEGRWNSLASSAGLKRTGKSCRLRWLNYLRPDVRRGNITLQEQLLILDLHSRWGNRWSKIAQYLPGRTDNEIKNYWRTRVQKHAKQLRCDVNSKQFKDTMRYLWMPTLLQRIQASSASALTHFDHSGAISSESDHSLGSTSDQLSPISHFNYAYCQTPLAGDKPNPSLDYCQTPHVTTHSHCITSLEPNNQQYWGHTHTHSATATATATGDTSDNFWNLENMLFLQHHLSDNM